MFSPAPFSSHYPGVILRGSNSLFCSPSRISYRGLPLTWEGWEIPCLRGYLRLSGCLVLTVIIRRAICPQMDMATYSQSMISFTSNTNVYGPYMVYSLKTPFNCFITWAETRELFIWSPQIH